MKNKYIIILFSTFFLNSCELFEVPYAIKYKAEFYYCSARNCANDEYPLVVEPGAEILFVNKSPEVKYYLWDFDTNEISLEKHSKYKYQRQGIYEVRLSVQDLPFTDLNSDGKITHLDALPNRSSKATRKIIIKGKEIFPYE